ncbi:gamma-glutamyl-gamma-aminobutyrate hydrolase, partial [Burkholderia vietnamiensis]
MSETTPSPAGLPGTFSASPDSRRSEPPRAADVPAAPAAQAAAAHDVADDGASPVTAASEPG